MFAKIDWIRSQLQKGETASNATSRLNTPVTIDNPVPQQQIPTPINLAEIRLAVSHKESCDVQNTLIWKLVLEAVAQSDYVAIGNHIAALEAGDFITEATVQSLQEIVSRTILDPSWQPTIQATPAQQAGFSLVYVHEVQEAIDSKDS